MIETRIVDVPQQDEFGNFARVLSNGTMYLVPGYPALRQQAGRKAELTGDWDFDGFGTVNPMGWRDVGAADVKPLQIMVSNITGEVIIDDPRVSREIIRQPIDRGLPDVSNQELFSKRFPNGEKAMPGVFDFMASNYIPGTPQSGMGLGLNPGINMYTGQTVNSSYTPGYNANNQISIGTIAGGVNAADPCKYLPAAAQSACRAALAVGTALVTGGSGSSPLSNQCSAGWTWNATLGKCVQLSNALPGGQPLTLGGGPVATTGGLGLAAVTPTQVGVITRQDGSTGPILKCPRRYVLGQDYLCYPKSMIPNQLRAHPRGTRPLLTGGEVKILRRAKTLEKKVSKLGRQFGTKTCHCGPKKGRKK